MARVTIAQTNFTGGEISPRVQGRVDIDRYANSAKTLFNAYPVIHGGAVRRPGTRYLGATKTSGTRSRLIPFISSRDDAYMLEFGNNYMRVWKNGAYLSVELTTTYTESMLADIDYTQDAATMFIAHPTVPIRRVRRFSDTVWDISDAPFITAPFAEQGRAPAATLTLSLATVGAGRTATASVASFEASDVGRAIQSEAGLAVITGYTSTTVVTVTISIAFASTSIASGAWSLDVSPQTTCTPSAVGPVGSTITLTLGAAGWRSGDVGSFVRLNSGLVRITGFTSTTVVNATVATVLANTTAAPALAWSLESAVWSAANGYPRTLTLHEQRLVAAGSTKYPQTMWGSRIGEFLDFTSGTADDDGYSFSISNDEANPIAYLSSARNLIALTYGGEFSLQGGVEKPITPTNVRIKAESPHGSKGVRPVLVGKETVFVQRAGRKVRAMGYRYDFDGYSSPDLTVLAEHITDASGGVVAMCYQQEPDQVLWCARGDGGLLSLTFDRDQSITAWAQHYTDGAFESVASIPAGDREQVWCVVRRIVNGVTWRYIERLDDTFAPRLPVTPDPSAFPPITPEPIYGCTVDCATSVDNASGQTTFTGLGYLQGKTVDIVADGSPMPRQTIPASGSITLPRASFRTLIGLPFSTRIEQLIPEVGTGTGSAQGNSMRTSEVTVRFLNTLGCKVVDGDGNVQELSFVNFGTGVLDVAPQLFSGSERIETLGWERGRSAMTILQEQPLPLHVLSITRKFTVND